MQILHDNRYIRIYISEYSLSKLPCLLPILVLFLLGVLLLLSKLVCLQHICSQSILE